MVNNSGNYMNHFMIHIGLRPMTLVPHLTMYSILLIHGSYLVSQLNYCQQKKYLHQINFIKIIESCQTS